MTPEQDQLDEMAREYGRRHGMEIRDAAHLAEMTQGPNDMQRIYNNDNSQQIELIRPELCTPWDGAWTLGLRQPWYRRVWTWLRTWL